MKKILFIRHAKSAEMPGFTDGLRPLTPQGEKDANLLSKNFLIHDFSPQAVFSSNAKRALDTCKIFMENLGWPQDLLTVTETLYDFYGDELSGFIYGLDDELDHIVLFGHNYAFTAMVNKLGDKYIDNVPTCGLVMIRFDQCHWNHIGNGHTELTLFPKQLR
ncbi:MAG TPA: histidine phosphatase family protein [Aquaticitalea sp.]|nr:histidine phosphatase family protein [Aquaticitalea sp.]